jgi:molecular chaperone HscB
VAADPASRRNCEACRAELTGALAPHVCASCGQPQPLLPSEDYFEALGTPRAFFQNADELEKRFYEISRALHPDRFSQSGPQAKLISLERMSFLNQAYTTLKNPDLLRSYLLEREGVELPKGQGPTGSALALAFEWFDVQDAVMEDPAEAPAKIQAFMSTITEGLSEQQRNLLSLERSYDENPSAPAARLILQQIAQGIHALSYLTSLQRDVERLKARLPGNSQGTG